MERMNTCKQVTALQLITNRKNTLMSLVFTYPYFHSEFHNVPDYNDNCKSSVGNQENSHRFSYKVLDDIDSKLPKERKICSKIISCVFTVRRVCIKWLR